LKSSQVKLQEYVMKNREFPIFPYLKHSNDLDLTLTTPPKVKRM